MTDVDALLEAFRAGYDENIAEQLGKSGDPRAVEPLLAELRRTRQINFPPTLPYPSPEHDAQRPLRHEHYHNWIKRVTLAYALGDLRDPRALPELEKLLTDTEELDFWGTGVHISIADVARHAIATITGEKA